MYAVRNRRGNPFSATNSAAKIERKAVKLIQSQSQTMQTTKKMLKNKDGNGIELQVLFLCSWEWKAFRFQKLTNNLSFRLKTTTIFFYHIECKQIDGKIGRINKKQNKKSIRLISRECSFVVESKWKKAQVVRVIGYRHDSCVLLVFQFEFHIHSQWKCESKKNSSVVHFISHSSQCHVTLNLILFAAPL